MITDTIHNLIHYRGIHPNLDTVVDWLQQNDITTLSLGKTVIDGNNVYVNVMETNLRKADGAEFEFHRLYADLQIDIDGAEYWEWSSADTAGSDLKMTLDLSPHRHMLTEHSEKPGLLCSSQVNLISQAVKLTDVHICVKLFLRLRLNDNLL